MTPIYGGLKVKYRGENKVACRYSGSGLKACWLVVGGLARPNVVNSVGQGFTFGLVFVTGPSHSKLYKCFLWFEIRSHTKNHIASFIQNWPRRLACAITRRYMQKQIFFLGNFYIFLEKKLIFARFFCTASVRSRSLDQPLVPGVLFMFSLR